MNGGRTASMPGRKWYWVAGAVGVAGAAGFVSLLLYGIAGIGDALMQVRAPGEIELALEEPGTYTVFHEYESVFEGCYYASRTVVSGLEVRVTPLGGGAAVAVRRAGTNSTYELAARSGVSIFEFAIADPGPYRVSAAYAGGGDSPAVVLAIGHDFMGKLMAIIFGGFGVMIAGLGGAGAITAVTYVKRDRAMAAREQGSAST